MSTPDAIPLNEISRDHEFSSSQLETTAPSIAVTTDFVAYPEGGYGWVVTGSAFVLCFLYLGMVYAWGVIQAELSTNIWATSFSLALIGSVSAFCLGFGCLPASSLLLRLGPRKTAASGVLIVAGALVGCGSCTHNLGGLIILQGLLFGVGGSLIYLTAYTIPSQFFNRRRGLSTGIASCGGGIGGAVWSIVIEKIIDRWGLPWAYRIMALSTLAFGMPAALLLRRGHTSVSNLTSATAEKSIFRSSRFIRLLLACFIASYPFFIPPYFIPQYVISIGGTASQGALYSAIFNVASGVGRIGFGLLGDSVTGNINAWSLSVLLIALSSLLVWPHALSQPLVVFFVLVCGTGSGGFFSLQSSVVGQILGGHRVSRGVGWIEVAESFGYFAGPISAGALLDAFGGVNVGAGAYLPAIYLVGGTTMASFLIIVSVRYSTDRILWKRV